MGHLPAYHKTVLAKGSSPFDIESLNQTRRNDIVPSSLFNGPRMVLKEGSIVCIRSTQNVSNVTTAIFFENIRRYCSDVQRFLSSASSPNFRRIEDRATEEEKQQPRNEKAEGKAGGMAEYSSRTRLCSGPVAWTSKRALIQELRYNANTQTSSNTRQPVYDANSPFTACAPTQPNYS